MTIASGKTVLLRARWTGSPPAIGDYLMAQQRPRNAYRIVSIRDRAACLELTCERVPPADVPTGSTIHDWHWDARTKAGSAWGAT